MQACGNALRYNWSINPEGGVDRLLRRGETDSGRTIDFIGYPIDAEKGKRRLVVPLRGRKASEPVIRRPATGIRLVPSKVTSIVITDGKVEEPVSSARISA